MKLRVFLVLLLSPLFVLSQSNYRNAHITNNNGEILVGYINYHDWDNNPDDIEFKNKPDDKEAQKLYPTAIRSFVIDGGDQYFTYSGKISTNRTRLPDLPFGRDTSSITATVFLKQIVIGNNVTLYSYTDAIKTRFFIQDKQQQPEELMYQQYYDGTSMQTKTISQFAGQLTTLILKYNGGTRLLNKTDRLTYDFNDIEDIVNGINGTKKVKINKLNTRFYIGAGLNITNVSMDIAGDVTNYGTTTVYTPKLSAGIDVFSNPQLQTVLFRIDVAAWYINPHFTAVAFDGSIRTFTFKQYTATLTPQIVWNIYNKENLKFYLDGGVGLNFSKYADDLYTTTYNGYGPGSYSGYKFNSVWFNFPVQVGAVINKHIELYYSDTFAAYGYTSALQTTFTLQNHVRSLGVHYLF